MQTKLVKLYSLKPNMSHTSQWKLFLTDMADYKCGDTLINVVNSSIKELKSKLNDLVDDYNLIDSYDSFDEFDKSTKDQFPEEFI